MYVTNLTGQSELLTDFNLLKRNKRINSQQTIEFEIHPTGRNEHAIDLVENESIITVFDEEYVIKNCATRAIGTSYVKRVTAIKKFYVDMLGKQQTRTHNGSMTFLAALEFTFENSGYTPSVSDGVFYAQEFQNLGNTNRLSILQTVIERYGAEFIVEENRVYFYAEIGQRTDKVFRYGHNIRAFEFSSNTNDLAMEISGTGANVGTEESPNYITATYVSPNASKYPGIGSAEPLNDERYTTTSSLLAALQSKIIDEPELSAQLDVAILADQDIEDLVEGDYINLIYEPFNDLELYVRIVEVNEYYDSNLNITESDITLANKPDTLTVSITDQIKHKIDEIKKEVTTVVQQSANGKNKNFYGVIKPTGGSLNDIWYKPVGAGEVEMWIHDGIDFIKTASSADNLGGTLNAAQLNVINLNANSIAGGSLNLARGISVSNGATEVLRVANNEVIMNVDTLKVRAKDVATTEYVVDYVGPAIELALGDAISETIQPIIDDAVEGAIDGAIGDVIDDAINDIEIGGRNLYLNSHLATFLSSAPSTSPITTTSFTANVFPYRRYAITNGASLPALSLYKDIKAINLSNSDFLGRNVTISFRVRANKNLSAQFNPYYQINGIGSAYVYPSDYNKTTTITTTWKTISYTYENFNGVINANTVFRTAPQVLTSSLVVGDYIEIGGYKIEFGNKASDYSKAPEDFEVTFTDLLRDKIGEEQFNEFFENYSGEIQVVINKMSELEQTANGFNFSITDIETILAGLQTFSTTVRSYLDFTSEDMLVIGKSNSPFRVQITNSQLNFLNGSDILAYMNGSKLFITDAEITNTIVIGNHIFQSGNNGTVIKWAGE